MAKISRKYFLPLANIQAYEIFTGNPFGPISPGIPSAPAGPLWPG